MRAGKSRMGSNEAKEKENHEWGRMARMRIGLGKVLEVPWVNLSISSNIKMMLKKLEKYWK